METQREGNRTNKSIKWDLDQCEKWKKWKTWCMVHETEKKRPTATNNCNKQRHKNYTTHNNDDVFLFTTIFCPLLSLTIPSKCTTTKECSTPIDCIMSCTPFVLLRTDRNHTYPTIPTKIKNATTHMAMVREN